MPGMPGMSGISDMYSVWYLCTGYGIVGVSGCQWVE